MCSAFVLHPRTRAQGLATAFAQDWHSNNARHLTGSSCSVIAVLFLVTAGEFKSWVTCSAIFVSASNALQARPAAQAPSHDAKWKTEPRWRNDYKAFRRYSRVVSLYPSDRAGSGHLH